MSTPTVRPRPAPTPPKKSTKSQGFSSDDVFMPEDDGGGGEGGAAEGGEMTRTKHDMKPAIAEVGRAVVRISQLCHVPESNDSEVEFNLPLVGGGRGSFVTVRINAARALRTLYKAKRRAWVDAFRAYVIGGMEPVDVMGRVIQASADGLARVPDRLYPVGAADATMAFDAASATWSAVPTPEVDNETYAKLEPIFRMPPELRAQAVTEMGRLTSLKYCSPGPRTGHATWTIGAYVYVCGGRRPNGVSIMDVLCLDTLTNTWVELAVTSAPEETPTPRHGHAAVTLHAVGADGGIGAGVVLGGVTDDEECLTDAYVCVCKPLERTIQWRRIFPVGRAPPGRAYHAAAAVREAPGSYAIYQFGGRSKGMGGNRDLVDCVASGCS